MPWPTLSHTGVAGEFFQVRSVANLVPPFQKDLERHDTSAALEFAVNHLKVSAGPPCLTCINSSCQTVTAASPTNAQVEQIIVLGHQKCGGIAALVNKRMVRMSDARDCGAVLRSNRLNVCASRTQPPNPARPGPGEGHARRRGEERLHRLLGVHRGCRRRVDAPSLQGVW